VIQSRIIPTLLYAIMNNEGKFLVQWEGWTTQVEELFTKEQAEEILKEPFSSPVRMVKVSWLVEEL
jgi:hypothetical protein